MSHCAESLTVARRGLETLNLIANDQAIINPKSTNIHLLPFNNTESPRRRDPRYLIRHDRLEDNIQNRRDRWMV
jgi:hypothetical protein